nr:unnamed protein product [Digitaria exilis]
MATIGALYAISGCFHLLRFLALSLRRPKDLRRCYGSWAVVTGPTSGLGRSMAMELARVGLNLVLVGRDPAKLQDVSDKIARCHGVQTKTVVFDLSFVSTPEWAEAMRRLREAIEGLDVGVLVNNAAVAKPGAMYFHEADVESLVRVVRVNLLALTEVTAAVLPGMVARGKGAVAPGLVDTNMMSSAVKNSFSPLFVVTADACARAVVRRIGHGTLWVPNFVHQIQWWSAGFAPETILDVYRLGKHLQQREAFRMVRSSRPPAQEGKVY